MNSLDQVLGLIRRGENAGCKVSNTPSSKSYCTYQRENDDKCDGGEENPYTHGRDGHIGS